jgi:hypothetical protein
MADQCDYALKKLTTFEAFNSPVLTNNIPMTEQQTIFDNSFKETSIVRRRDVMPLALKIYVWVGMVGSGLGIIKTIFSIPAYKALMNATNDPATIIFPVILLLSNALLIFLMTFLLWMEVKWAIKFNWGVGCLWVFFVLLACYAIQNLAAFSIFVPFLVLFIPYFALLFYIRKKWTQKAVSGKSLKATT